MLLRINTKVEFHWCYFLQLVNDKWGKTIITFLNITDQWSCVLYQKVFNIDSCVINKLFASHVACVVVVSVSLTPSEASMKDVRGHLGVLLLFAQFPHASFMLALFVKGNGSNFYAGTSHDSWLLNIVFSFFILSPKVNANW